MCGWRWGWGVLSNVSESYLSIAIFRRRLSHLYKIEMQSVVFRASGVGNRCAIPHKLPKRARSSCGSHHITQERTSIDFRATSSALKSPCPERARAAAGKKMEKGGRGVAAGVVRSFSGGILGGNATIGTRQQNMNTGTMCITNGAAAVFSPVLRKTTGRKKYVGAPRK